MPHILGAGRSVAPRDHADGQRLSQLHWRGASDADPAASPRAALVRTHLTGPHAALARASVAVYRIRVGGGARGEGRTGATARRPGRAIVPPAAPASWPTCVQCASGAVAVACPRPSTHASVGASPARTQAAGVPQRGCSVAGLPAELTSGPEIAAINRRPALLPPRWSLRGRVRQLLDVLQGAWLASWASSAAGSGGGGGADVEKRREKGKNGAKNHVVATWPRWSHDIVEGDDAEVVRSIDDDAADAGEGDAAADDDAVNDDAAEVRSIDDAAQDDDADRGKVHRRRSRGRRRSSGRRRRQRKGLETTQRRTTTQQRTTTQRTTTQRTTTQQRTKRRTGQRWTRSCGPCRERPRTTRPWRLDTARSGYVPDRPPTSSGSH